jgi:hypothetical protein
LTPELFDRYDPPSMLAGRFGSFRSGFDRFLRFSADGVLALLLATAFLSLSRAHDVWNYHLPFAARLVGLVTEQHFLFDTENTERYKGFPLLSEFIQGVLWRVFGRPQAANLLSAASVPVFAWFLRRRFSVPWHVSVLALLAIPLVQAHAADSFIDLPSSVAVAALILITIRAFTEVQPLGLGWLLLAFVSAAFAVNSKAIVGPTVALAAALLGARLLWLSRRLPDAERRRYRIQLAAFVVLLPIVFATPLKNLARYHNPVFPFKAQVFGYELPGTEPNYHSSPTWLEHVSRPTRFAASLLEMGARPLSDPARWTYGQMTPPDHPGLRMGGFFSAYVLFNLALLGFRLVRDRSREAIAAASGLAVMTLLVSVIPQSHELRYHIYWMIVLVSINLWLAARPGATLIGPLGLGAVSLVALGVVVAVSRGVFLTPRSETFEELIARRAPRSAIAKIAEGSTACIERPGSSLLWAAPFHPPRQYRIQAGSTEVRECSKHDGMVVKPRRRKRAR